MSDFVVAHTGDLHVTAGPRLEATRRVLDFIVETCHARQVDAALVGGDLTGTEPNHLALPAERIIVCDFLRGLGAACPVIVAEGNHEASRDLEVYERLATGHGIFVATRPTVVEPRPGLFVYVMPYPSKRWVALQSDGTLATTQAQVEDGLRAILTSWRLLATQRPEAAHVGLGHFQVRGCRVGGGEVLMGQEVELTVHDLRESGLHVWGVSHIHKAQAVVPGFAFYPGSPAAQNFGEPDRKGFHLYRVRPGAGLVDAEWIATPARRLLSFVTGWTPTDGFRVTRDDGSTLPVVQALTADGGVDDAEVRFVLALEREHRDLCPQDELTTLATSGGAALVKIDPRTIPTVRSRLADAPAVSQRTREQLTEEDVDPDRPTGDAPAPALSLADAWHRAHTARSKLLLWGEATGTPISGRVLERLSDLEDAVQETGGHVGQDVPPGTIGVERVTYRGLWSCPDRDVTLDVAGLGAGIVAVIGENGAGKTTLLEATGPAPWLLEWPSYGYGLRDMVPDGVRDARIDLDWSRDGDRFRSLIRMDTRHGGGAGKTEAYLAHAPAGASDFTPVAGPNQREYATALARLLPDRELFYMTAFAAQATDKAPDDFFSASRSTRRDLVIRMLALGWLQQLAEQADAALAAEHATVARLEAQLATATALVDQRDALAAEIAQLTDAAERAARLVTPAETTTQAAQAQVSTLREQLAAATARRDALVAENARRAARARAIADRLVEIDGDRRAHATVLAQAADVEERGRIVAATTREVLALERQLGTATATLEARRVEEQHAIAALRAVREAFTTAKERAETTARAVQQSAAVPTYESDRDTAAARRDRCTAALDQLAAPAEPAERAIILAALEEAETEAGIEQKHLAALDVLESRARDLASRIGLVGQLEQPEHPMCTRCPLTADAMQAAVTLGALWDGHATLSRTIIAHREAASIRAATYDQPEPTTMKPWGQVMWFLRADLKRVDEQHREAVQAVERQRRTLTAERDQHEAARVGAQRALDDLAEMRNLAAQHPEAERALAAAQVVGSEAVERHTAAEQATHAAQAVVDDLAQQIRATEARRDAACEGPGVEEITTAREATARLEAERAALVDEAAGLDPDPVPDVTATEGQVAAAEADLARAEATLRDARAFAADATRARDTAAGRLEQMGDPSADVRRLTAALAQAREDVVALTTLARGLGRDGIQTLELDAAGPHVAAIVNRLLEAGGYTRFSMQLDTQADRKGRGKGQKEVFEWTIIDAERGGAEMRRGSPGQMAVLREAVRLGFSIFVAQRAGVRFRILWRDEPSAPLSPMQASRYVAMLRRAMAPDLGGWEQVLLVSHQPPVWNAADVRAVVDADGIHVTTDQLDDLGLAPAAPVNDEEAA